MAERKLPVRQLTILSLCRFAEPIALTSVFPYLPEMIESFGVPETEIAKWAGIAVAIFSICQCLTGIPWGRASDRFGRKSVILVGLTNTMVTSLLWGFSTNLPMALVARALAGAGNGNVGIIRTMVAEMCPWKELQPRAFSIMPLVWNVGSIFGPAFGGALSNPLRQNPRGPRGSKFLEKFPYALPNLIAASLFLIGIVIGFLFLEETLETQKNKPDYGRMLGQRLVKGFQSLLRRVSGNTGSSSGEQDPLLKSQANSHAYQTVNDEEASLLDGDSDGGPTPSGPPGFREVLTRQSVINLVVYTLLALYAMGYDQLLPVFMHHPVQGRNALPQQPPFRFSNGFGLASSRIGLIFTLYGGFGMLVQFFIFPPVAHRYGVLRCLRVCNCILPFVFFVTPFTALLPTAQSQQVAIFVLMVCKGICTTFMFPCNTILLTNSASSLRILGTLNGMATSISAIGRAIGPAIGGSMFTFGVKHNLAILPFWIFAFIAALSIIPVMMLNEGKGFGDDEVEDEDTEESMAAKAIKDVDYAETPEPIAVPREEAVLNAEVSYGSPGPLGLSRTSTRSTAFGSTAMESDTEDDDTYVSKRRYASLSSMNQPGSSSRREEVEWSSPLGTSPRVPRTQQRRRRSSIPVGGADFRKLSSNLGQSNSGYGSGSWAA